MKPTVLTGRNAIVLLAVTLAVIAPVSASQSPPSPTKWWKIYQGELSLTPDQSRRLEEIFQAALPGQRALKVALDDAEAQLERYVEEGDQKAATEQITRVVSARASLQTSQALMFLDMRLVLTRDQWIRLGELQRITERERAQAKGGATAKGDSPDKGK